MTHASNICGTILPIQAVGALCKEKGIPFVVDAAQTAGILPLSMKDLHAAAIAFTGHKACWALGHRRYGDPGRFCPADRTPA